MTLSIFQDLLTMYSLKAFDTLTNAFVRKDGMF